MHHPSRADAVDVPARGRQDGRRVERAVAIEPEALAVLVLDTVVVAARRRFLDLLRRHGVLPPLVDQALRSLDALQAVQRAAPAELTWRIVGQLRRGLDRLGL